MPQTDAEMYVTTHSLPNLGWMDRAFVWHGRKVEERIGVRGLVDYFVDGCLFSRKE